MTERRTKRRYAHELYPHGGEHEVRPLAVEVPYLYARALGLEIRGTGWFTVEPRTVAGDRTWHLIDARHRAFNADALLQGLSGQEAWEWAESRALEESGELVWERALLYGVDPDALKPYPCGPEPDRHEHLSPRDARGAATVTVVWIKESECEECTEPVEVPDDAA
ncbi:hypothetical protein [Microbacterium trichothecenolyticum]|uniref:Uncharacterized protein n=1 Tax=Microbacterium trichothecenolyticum TaxID=69370 RepID=A0A0M2HL22_MICTR|nr:hypothetical protein [Microbacterium trichothecenolyticum]KJL45600.1 hypothetical protein RS82_00152 [Microbacterium trichothecenolyticum]